jgi:hypothetical protein
MTRQIYLAKHPRWNGGEFVGEGRGHKPRMERARERTSTRRCLTLNHDNLQPGGSELVCRDETIWPRAYDYSVVAFHFDTPAVGEMIAPTWFMPMELQRLYRANQKAGPDRFVPAYG